MSSNLYLQDENKILGSLSWLWQRWKAARVRYDDEPPRRTFKCPNDFLSITISKAGTSLRAHKVERAANYNNDF
jgi:hypothetical protein